MNKKEIIKLFKHPEVLMHLKKFSKNQVKLEFFNFLMENRNFSDLDESEALDIVKGVAHYVVTISESEISRDEAFFLQKPDTVDLVRQKYHVYSSPRSF
jgi:hypothetical protein